MTDIKNLVSSAREENVKSPAIIVVGEVVEAFSQVENTIEELSLLN